MNEELARRAIRRWGEDVFLKVLPTGALMQELQRRGFHGELVKKRPHHFLGDFKTFL